MEFPGFHGQVEPGTQELHCSLIEWGDECDRATEADPSRGSHEFGMEKPSMSYSVMNQRAVLESMRCAAMRTYVRLIASVHSLP